MRKIWPFSLLNDEQMSNKVEVKHQPGPLITGDGATLYVHLKKKMMVDTFCLAIFWECFTYSPSKVVGMMRVPCSIGGIC